MKIGVIGTGPVGQTLADGFLKHGHGVMRGSRDPAKLAAWKAGAGPGAQAGGLAETARFGELVVLAVKGSGAAEAIGWETEDMGTAEAARAVEPLCMLWCIPGFRRNDWTHAFKLLRR